MRVYFNGKLALEDPNYGRDTLQWRTTSTINIPAGTEVIGIACLDAGVAKGIIASTSDGLVTDHTWLCTSVNGNNWANLHSTAQFQHSVTVGSNGNQPWGFR